MEVPITHREIAVEAMKVLITHHETVVQGRELWES